jgi:hypothetical protein
MEQMSVSIFAKPRINSGKSSGVFNLPLAIKIIENQIRVAKSIQ